MLRRADRRALLQRGQFDAVDAANTARALAGFALGLGAFSVYMFTLRGFYAHKDTRTPFVLNVVENLINIVLAVRAGRPLRRARPGPGVRASRTSCRRCGRSR